MKTNNLIYKALSLVALLCLGQTAAWGDNAVTGNKYSSVGSEVISARLVGGTGWQSGGWYNNHTYDLAYDGNNGTYAQQADHYTNPTLTFDLIGRELDEIQFRTASGRDNTQPRPQAIVVEKGDSEDGPWTEVQRFTFNRQNETETVILNQAITSSYVRLTFEVSDDYRRTVEVYEVSLFSSASSATIQHKDAKWFDLKENLGLDNDAVGSFNYDQRRFPADMSVASEGLQATHTYIDTIYVHKGSNVKLILHQAFGLISDGTVTAQTIHSRQTAVTEFTTC